MRRSVLRAIDRTLRAVEPAVDRPAARSVRGALCPRTC
ncbi:hypothetical protein BDSB_19350 [Burkholderia dolosa PC543]|nr:hypothetical protein BDSB_19350 [Burkholderia dolosa PC543]